MRTSPCPTPSRGPYRLTARTMSMHAATNSRVTGPSDTLSADGLVGRVRARGGELRLVAGVVQFRPAWVLTAAERRWLARHHRQVVEVLQLPLVGTRVAVARWPRAWYGAEVTWV